MIRHIISADTGPKHKNILHDYVYEIFKCIIKTHHLRRYNNLPIFCSFVVELAGQNYIINHSNITSTRLNTKSEVPLEY